MSRNCECENGMCAATAGIEKPPWFAWALVERLSASREEIYMVAHTKFYMFGEIKKNYLPTPPIPTTTTNESLIPFIPSSPKNS